MLENSSGEEKNIVLIVEDEKDTKEGLMKILSPLYIVHAVENGHDALEAFDLYCTNTRGLIVLLDIKLPDIDGLEVLKRMNEISRIPNIIILTAYKDIPLAVSALNFGVYDFLGKPFSTEKLLESVKKAREMHDFTRKFRILKENFIFDKIAGLYRQYRLTQEKIREKMRTGRDLEIYERVAAFAVEFKNIKELESALFSEASADVRAFVEKRKNKKLSMLIVEDENQAREGLVKVFSANYEVMAASDGEEALELLNKNSFDFILLDIRLPGINGMEVLKKIKEIQLDADVIMTTAVDEIETAVEAIKIGAFDYLTKPFDFTVLKEKINLIKEKRYYEFTLEYLIKHLEEEKLSYAKRKTMVEEFRQQQYKQGKIVTIGDVHTFLPEILSLTAAGDYAFLELMVPESEPLDLAIEKIQRMSQQIMEEAVNIYLKRGERIENS